MLQPDNQINRTVFYSNILQYTLIVYNTLEKSTICLNSLQYIRIVCDIFE